MEFRRVGFRSGVGRCPVRSPCRDYCRAVRSGGVGDAMRTGSAARTRLMLKPRADVARAGRFRLHRGLAATIMPAMRPSRLAIAASLLLLLVSLTVAGTWLWGRHALYKI